MNDITSQPLKDQPWIKENMYHLRCLKIIAIFQSVTAVCVFICGVSFIVCLACSLQISPGGVAAAIWITVTLLILGIVVSTILHNKFTKHLAFLGISTQKHQQLLAWSWRCLIGLALFGFLFFIPIYLFILVDNLEWDAKKRIANNEPCFIKKEQHQADFLPPSSSTTSDNQ